MPSQMYCFPPLPRAAETAEPHLWRYSIASSAVVGAGVGRRRILPPRARYLAIKAACCSRMTTPSLRASVRLEKAPERCPRVTRVRGSERPSAHVENGRTSRGFVPSPRLPRFCHTRERKIARQSFNTAHRGGHGKRFADGPPPSYSGPFSSGSSSRVWHHCSFISSSRALAGIDAVDQWSPQQSRNGLARVRPLLGRCLSWRV